MTFLVQKSWIAEEFNKKIANNEIKYIWINEIHFLIKLFFEEFNICLIHQQLDNAKFKIFIDLLPIKIEGILRDILYRNDTSTFKITSYETTEEGNINSYLKEDKLLQIFSNDEIAYFKWLLIDTKNLRNKSAHCLMHPADYNIENACLLFVAFLRLCKAIDKIIIKNN